MMVVSQPEPTGLTYDDARPDAAPPELAEIQPRYRGVVIHRFLHPELSAHERRPDGSERDPRDRGRPDDHGRHLPPGVSGSAAELPACLRRQPERAATQADGDRSADPAAADRRARRGR